MAANPTVSRRIPKLCLHKATGRAVVRLSGHDVYCGKFGSADAKAQYDKLVIEWFQRGRVLPPWVTGVTPDTAPTAGASPVAGLSVAELLLAYKIHTDEYHKNTSAEREKIRLALRPLRELYALTAASEFGPLALKSVRERMLQAATRTVSVRDEKGEKVGERVIEYRLSRRTINQRIGIVKRLFAWSVENQHVPATVWHGLLAVKGLKKGRSTAKESRIVKPVPEEAVAAVLPLVSAPVRAMIEFQQLTGARSGEVCGMRPCDIDRVGEVWVYRPIRHKNEYRENAQPREIFIGPKAQAVLELLLNRDSNMFMFSPHEARAERYRKLREARKTKVQPSQFHRTKARPKKILGAAYNVKSYYHAVRRACQKAGIPLWHPHQLRHSAATMLRREFGIETARIILGHSTAFTTEIYAQTDRESASKAMSKVG